MKVFQFNHVSFFSIFEAGMLSSVLLVSVFGLYGEKARKKSLLNFNIFILSIQPNKKSKLNKLTMVVSFWSYPTILKVCCCVSMLLLVLLNDCVIYFVDLEFLLLIDFHFCRTLSIIDVVVILILFASFQDLSSHLQLSSLNVMFLLMDLTALQLLCR
jgi:hypothetical protein